MSVLGSTWRHRETGAHGRVTGRQWGNTAATVTLHALDRPVSPSDEWPFPVNPNFIDVGSGPYHHWVPGSWDLDPLTIPVAELRSDWEQE